MQPNILGGQKTLGCTVYSNKLVWEIMVQSDGDDDRSLPLRRFVVFWTTSNHCVFPNHVEHQRTYIEKAK